MMHYIKIAKKAMNVAHNDDFQSLYLLGKHGPIINLLRIENNGSVNDNKNQLVIFEKGFHFQLVCDAARQQ